MATTTTPAARRFELDWLRVLAIAAVFLFHSARFFDPPDWHVKNPTTYPALEIAAALVVVWMMPLLFTISGASTFYALRNRSGGAFLIVRWAMPDLAKWALIALISLPLYLGLYWFVIRPVNLLRFLFGMKPHGGQPVPYTFANGRHVR
jgi:hypothetical protein